MNYLRLIRWQLIFHFLTLPTGNGHMSAMKVTKLAKAILIYSLVFCKYFYGGWDGAISITLDSLQTNLLLYCDLLTQSDVCYS